MSLFLYREKRYHYLWWAVVAIAAAFISLYFPLNLHFELWIQPEIKLVFWITTIVFIADFFINLSAYRNEKKRSGQSTFSKLKLNGLLCVDLIAAIPFVFFFETGVLQLIPLIKLLRVGQYFLCMSQMEVRYSLRLTIIFFLFWLSLFVHWLCCGWLYLFGVDSTLSIATNYISSLYWIMTTLTAVGYGDIVPVTNMQRMYAMGVQMTGIAIFGYLIGYVVKVISVKDPDKTRYSENVELLTTTLKRRGLPRDLQKRILDYYSYLRDEKMGYDESSFINSLPNSLKNEAALHLKKDFIEGIPLFKNASEKFIFEIALKLKLIVVTPSDYIFKAGDPGNEMYFIIQGELNVLNQKEDQIFSTLKDGEFFGEIALFKHEPRSATVQAISYCNLYKLDRKTFEQVCSNHPEISDQIRDKALDREKRS